MSANREQVLASASSRVVVLRTARASSHQPGELNHYAGARHGKSVRLQPGRAASHWRSAAGGRHHDNRLAEAAALHGLRAGDLTVRLRLEIRLWVLAPPPCVLRPAQRNQPAAGADDQQIAVSAGIRRSVS